MTDRYAARRAAAADRLRHARAARAFASRHPAGILVGLALAISGVISAVAVTAPEQATATPTSVTTAAVPATAFTTAVRTGQALAASAVIAFSSPMDPASVESALAIQPAAGVGLTWDASQTHLTIAPTRAWRAGTYYVLTVGRTARGADGRPLATPARVAFLTRPASTARLMVAADGAGAAQIVGPNAQFAVTVTGDVDPVVLAGSVVVEPSVPGHVAVTSIEEPATPTDQRVWRAVFVPRGPLPTGTIFTLSLAPGLRDRDGQAISVPSMVVKTGAVPDVTRFRPSNHDVLTDRGARLSVRFDQPMDPVATARAFTALSGGRALPGRVSWAEGSKVLIFDPSSSLPAGATVSLVVGTGARSAEGFSLARARGATFTVASAAVASSRATSSGTARSSGSGSSGSGGGAVGAGSWGAVEGWYLGLLNCTRGGGLVTSSGGCSGPGGSGLRSFMLDAGISTKVTRPYAKVLADRNLCGHTYSGTYAQRLARGGYGHYSARGENVGCYNAGTARGGVLWSHLQFQSERSYNGGHWANIMNPRFDRVGIGVWVTSGRTRLVVDFYHP